MPATPSVSDNSPTARKRLKRQEARARSQLEPRWTGHSNQSVGRVGMFANGLSAWELAELQMRAEGNWDFGDDN